MRTIEAIAIRAGTGLFALVLGIPATGLPGTRCAALSRETAGFALFGGSAVEAERSTVAGANDEREQREEDLYEEGSNAIDEEHWQQAMDKFDQVAKMRGKKADAALYWKAWAQNKLGQRTAALATIEELRHTAPQSRWVNDAKALEIEIRQELKQPLSPDVQSDCELKLLAINGLQQMDPEKAVPMLEKMLHGSACPKLRGQALFVLAESNSQQARDIIAKAARNNEDPELQKKAIQDLGLFAGEWGRKQLSEIYAGAKDRETKKRVMQAFMVSGDREHLLAAAKGEADPVLRAEAIQQLGVMGAREDIWLLYEKETSVEVKKRVLQAMWISGDMDHVVQLAKTEKDHDLRMAAIQDLGLMGEKTADTLVAMYSADSDRDVKRAVIQGLFLSGNAKVLVTLARKEKDPEMKKAIVQQLALMQSKEATDYLMEILNK